MSRREMLQALAALAVTTVAPQVFAQGALSRAQFASLSKSITGYTFADGRVAATVMSALAAAVGTADLSRLAQLALSTPADRLAPAIRAAGLTSTAETVVAALYTGTMNTPRGVRVISYDQALIWQALAWTKPNAFCGGETNYWAAPPSTATT
ncbi:MAG TPA: sugar dehydrogenase complex small subunit [Casimicrobiaceae bacterium]|nr:sugar dehydrogenase complex small subunit [Casimicrobiaceae bacterium]